MESRSEKADRTRSQTVNGDAVGKMAATLGEITPDPNGLANAMERYELAKIRRNRDAGRLPTMLECDFLLSIAERVCR